MKLILLAQTAFGLNLKEVFNHNFENTDIATHGCHCARISGHSKTAANSDQTSDLDTQCHNWQRARNCAKQSHQCHAFDNDYDSSVECEDQINPCRILTCRLDKEFVTRINSAKAGIDFSASAQCSFDFQTPQAHENRACCLSDNFESEFYNYNEKTCNNGVVSTEPVEFTENHLTQLVAHLRTIPNLPFNVTDEWRGPGIGNLNDLNGAILDDLDSAPEPVQTNVRKKRQNLPSRFDLRDDVRCGMIARGVDNTGACASCYAQAASTVASISMCIASNGASQHRLSAMDIMNCGAGQSPKPCQGGNIVAAAYHFKNNGLVTGSSLLERLGEIEYDVGCFPYRAGPGSSHNDESYLQYIPPYDNPPRGYTIDMSRNCPTECYADYPKIMEHKPFVNDKKGNDPNLQLVNYAGNVLNAMQHIRDHGPLIAVMAVYDDFLTYGGGIYEPHSINFQGSYRTVALIGWGSENGKDYWIVKDAKGKDWGENGFFRIIRGVNAVGIENFLMAGFKWNCASGQVVDENGKCKTAECAGNQYREGNDCINCPMNAQANSDNTGCQIKSEQSQTQRLVLWSNYGYETARPILIAQWARSGRTPSPHLKENRKEKKEQCIRSSFIYSEQGRGHAAGGAPEGAEVVACPRSQRAAGKNWGEFPRRGRGEFLGRIPVTMVQAPPQYAGYLCV